MSVSSFTQKNQLLYAFKKHLGVAHTSAQKEFYNESLPSYIQQTTSLIMAESISTPPSGFPPTLDNNTTAIDWNTSNRTFGVLQIVDFDLEVDVTTIYTGTPSSLSINSDVDTASTSPQPRAFKLKLPAGYETDARYNFTGQGNDPFVNSKKICDTGGKLQLVPPSINPAYRAFVFSSTQTINPNDNENYLLDYSNGILFVQDQAFTGSRVPDKVRAVLYIGQYLDAYINTIQNNIISNSLFKRKTSTSGTVVFNDTLTPALTELEIPNLRVTNELRVTGNTVIVNVTEQNLLVQDNKIVLNSQRDVNEGFSGLCFREYSTTTSPNNSLGIFYYDDNDDELKFATDPNQTTLPSSISNINSFANKFYIPKYEVSEFDTTSKREIIPQIGYDTTKGYLIKGSRLSINVTTNAGNDTISLLPVFLNSGDRFIIGSATQLIEKLYASLTTFTYSTGTIPFVGVNNNELVKVEFNSATQDRILITRATGVEAVDYVDGGSF